ncbi:MAG: phosphotransferase family protein [Ignavibacteria bacterium]
MNPLTFLHRIFYKQHKEKPKRSFELRGGVSGRRIYRILSESKSCIGIFHPYIRENKAFISFTETFKELGLRVPEIISVDKSFKYYLLEDLGDLSLKDISFANNIHFTRKNRFYKQALSDLLAFQILGKEHIDFNYCYESKNFDKQQIFFDIKRFQTFFVQQILESSSLNIDLTHLYTLLWEKIRHRRDRYFMYRDFQPRNILVKDEALYYIDYQAGRRGPREYDIASFLYSSSIMLTEKEREKLLEYYINLLEETESINRKTFISDFKIYAIIRLIQVIGNYGYTFYAMKNTKRLNAIPSALKKIRTIHTGLNKIDNYLSILSDQKTIKRVKNFIHSVEHQ